MPYFTYFAVSECLILQFLASNHPPMTPSRRMIFTFIHRKGSGALSLHHHLLFLIAIETETDVGTIVLENGQQLLLHLGVDEKLAISCLVKTTLGIRRTCVEIVSLARRYGLAEVSETSRPYLPFGYEMIRAAIAVLQLETLGIEHLKGVITGERLDILRITSASVATCAGCHRTNYTEWNVLHIFILYFDLYWMANSRFSSRLGNFLPSVRAVLRPLQTKK